MDGSDHEGAVRDEPPPRDAGPTEQVSRPPHATEGVPIGPPTHGQAGTYIYVDLPVRAILLTYMYMRRALRG